MAQPTCQTCQLCHVVRGVRTCYNMLQDVIRCTIVSLMGEVDCALMAVAVSVINIIISTSQIRVAMLGVDTDNARSVVAMS